VFLSYTSEPGFTPGYEYLNINDSQCEGRGRTKGSRIE
jgi:hypothetical protein